MKKLIILSSLLLLALPAVAAEKYLRVDDYIPAIPPPCRAPIPYVAASYDGTNCYVPADVFRDVVEALPAAVVVDDTPSEGNTTEAASSNSVYDHTVDTTDVHGQTDMDNPVFDSATVEATLGANAVTIDATCTGWSAGGALLDCGAGNTNGWCCNASTSVQKIADGTTAITYNAGEADGQDVQLVYTTSGLSGGNISASGGGITLSANSTNNTFTVNGTFTGTGNLTFTPSVTGVRVVLSGVSVKAITNGAATTYGETSKGNYVSYFAGTEKYKNFYIDPYNTGPATTSPGMWHDGTYFRIGSVVAGGVPVYVQGGSVTLQANGTVSSLLWDGQGLYPTAGDMLFGYSKFGTKFPVYKVAVSDIVNTNSGAVPVLSSCGTTPAVATGSSNFSGKISFGTSAGTPSACTLTWGVAYTNTPECTVTVVGAVDAYLRITAESNTAMTVTASGASDLSSTSFNYNCVGLNE